MKTPLGEQCKRTPFGKTATSLNFSSFVLTYKDAGACLRGAAGGGCGWLIGAANVGGVSHAERWSVDWHFMLGMASILLGILRDGLVML